MIKTFRGKLADGGQDTILLHTNTGSIGYRIKKFQVMPTTDNDIESTMKIYKIKQSSITSDIDFSDNTLLGAAFYTQEGSAQGYPEDMTVIFDNEIFNQDIYVTLKGHNYTAPLNYYIELEQMKLDINENTVATLKDIRNITAA